MKRIRTLTGAIALSMASHFGGTTRGLSTVKGKKARPCVNCGKLHTHNNCYCSVQCCKEHRAVMKKAKQAARA